MKHKFVWLLFITRIFTNIVIFAMWGFSVWAINKVSNIKEPETFLEQNAVSITVSFITLIYPNIFDLIGKLEGLHPRSALRLQLIRFVIYSFSLYLYNFYIIIFRVSILYVLNYYTLIISLFSKLKDLENERLLMDVRCPKTRKITFQESFNTGLTYDYLHHTGNVTVARTLRQIFGYPPPTPHSYFSYVKVTYPPTTQAPLTTPAPDKPWTTVSFKLIRKNLLLQGAEKPIILAAEARLHP